MVDLVFLLFEVLLEMFVVLSPHRNHNPSLPFLVALIFPVNAVILFALNSYDFEAAGVYAGVYKLLFGDEDYFGQIFDGIGDDTAHKLVVGPYSSNS